MILRMSHFVVSKLPNDWKLSSIRSPASANHPIRWLLNLYGTIGINQLLNARIRSNVTWKFTVESPCPETICHNEG